MIARQVLFAGMLVLAACVPPSAPHTDHEWPIQGPKPGSPVILRLKTGLAPEYQLPPIQGNLVTISDSWIAVERNGSIHWVLLDNLFELIEVGG